MHGKRHQSDADDAAAVCEQRTRETCIRARYRTIYGCRDMVRSTNPRSISRYRVMNMITSQMVGFSMVSHVSGVRIRVIVRIRVRFSFIGARLYAMVSRKLHLSP